jgi:integrase
MAILTTRAVEAAKPGRTRNEIPDGTHSGLYLAVEPTGTKSWVLRCRHAGASKRITLGRAGEGGLTLVAARHAAAAARHRLEQRISPSVTPVTAVTPKADGGGDKIEAAVAAFIELHHNKKNRTSTIAAAERIFNRLVLPAWRGRSIHDIRRRDVIDLVEQVATDRPCLANRTVAVLAKFFSWMMARDMIEASPVDGVERPHREQARQRVLTDAELKALWISCEGDGPFGSALRLLALTGARRNEVSDLTWSEIDLDRGVWTLPSARAKNHHEHAITLSPQAIAIITSMPRLAGCPFVFTAGGRGPIGGWSKAKRRISAKAGLAEESWRLHDLRRTAASGMQKLGIAVPVIEKCLNRVSGTFRGIVGTYQQHDYAAEIAIALQKWGDHVEQLAGLPAKRGKRRPMKRPARPAQLRQALTSSHE